MTYFQHTKRDVEEARLAGRREVAELFAALLEDTARKMNGEPDGETEYDRQYLVEDLLTRGAELAKNYAYDMPQLFPALVDNMRGTPAIPLLDAPAVAKQENTIDLTQAIREAWTLQTFDGLPRHEHEGPPDDKCRARVRPVYGDPHPMACGKYWGHSIHETDFDTRSDRP